MALFLVGCAAVAGMAQHGMISKDTFKNILTPNSRGEADGGDGNSNEDGTSSTQSLETATEQGWQWDDTNDRTRQSKKDDLPADSFRLNPSAIELAQSRIRQAQADRDSSKIPKKLIPIVEMCLPRDKRLKDVEDRVEGGVEIFQRAFMSCSSRSLECIKNTAFHQDGTEIEMMHDERRKRTHPDHHFSPTLDYEDQLSS